jgi:hypothetical protein
MLLALSVLVGLALAPAAGASTGSHGLPELPVAVDHGTVVEFGHDAIVNADESATTVVAIGGNVYVHGTVTTAVAVGGNVTVDGRVKRTIVAVGGNVDLTGGWVGADNSPNDTAVVLVGGTLTRGPGSVLTGNITNVKGAWFTDVVRFGVWNPIAHPYSVQAVVPWIVQTIVFAIIAIIVSATMPRQLGAVARQLRRRTLASFGWGALGSFIVIPVSVVILTITIIGLLLVIPGVFLGLPLTLLFVGTAVAAVVGGLVLSGTGQRDNVMLASLTGVAILSLVRFVPFFGLLAVVLAWFFGLGALVLAIAEWQHARRQLRRAARVSAAGGPPQPPAAFAGPTPPSPPSPPVPSVWQTPAPPSPPSPSVWRTPEAPVGEANGDTASTEPVGPS